MKREWHQSGAEFIRKAYATSGTGVEYDEERERTRLAAEIETLTWREPNGQHPMSPALLIKEVVAQLGLKAINRIAYGGYIELPDGPETGTYSLVAIECRLRAGGVMRLYLLDVGIGAHPVALDDLDEAEVTACGAR